MPDPHQRLEAAYQENPGIGRVKLAKAARVSKHQATKFLKEQRARIPLTDDNVFKTCPQDQSKKRFFELDKDKGYPVDELVKQWELSPETIRKHARRWDALRYVEASPGNYVACVLHPETAKRYKDGART